MLHAVCQSQWKSSDVEISKFSVKLSYMQLIADYNIVFDVGRHFAQKSLAELNSITRWFPLGCEWKMALSGLYVAIWLADKKFIPNFDWPISAQLADLNSLLDRKSHGWFPLSKQKKCLLFKSSKVTTKGNIRPFQKTLKALSFHYGNGVF